MTAQDLISTDVEGQARSVRCPGGAGLAGPARAGRRRLRHRHDRVRDDGRAARHHRRPRREHPGGRPPGLGLRARASSSARRCSPSSARGCPARCCCSPAGGLRRSATRSPRSPRRSARSSSPASPAGLPHGAYFGTAAIVAASLVDPARRARAVARVMLGLTVANIVGVPLATLLGQTFGWRSTYWSVSVIGAARAASRSRCSSRGRRAARREPPPRARRAAPAAGAGSRCSSAPSASAASSPSTATSPRR